MKMKVPNEEAEEIVEKVRRDEIPEEKKRAQKQTVTENLRRKSRTSAEKICVEPKGAIPVMEEFQDCSFLHVFERITI